VEVDVDNPKINREEAKSFVRQKENYKILGFAKFHLWLYNLSSKKKTDDWLKRIGEPPQVYNEALAVRSEDQLKQFLNNKGYFRAKVGKEVEFKEKKRKVDIKYNVETGEQYRIQRINYHISDSTLRTLFFNDTSTFIRAGTPFDFFLLDKQRTNIVDLFRNNGYYYFSKEDVRYLADSSKVEKEIILDLFIGSTRENPSDSAKVYRPYFLNKFFISVLPGNTSVSSSVQETANTFSDTLVWDDFVLYRNNLIEYRPNLFKRSMQMNSGERYNLAKVEHTFTAFNRLRQFRFIDIQFGEPAFLNDTNLLDCYIRLAPLNKQTTSFDIEGTNTSGNMGVAGSVNYQHRNLFKGGEIFQVNFKGAMERQQRLGTTQPEYFNTRELGVESNLTIPKLLGPGQFIRSFEAVLPKTVFTMGYNFQRRREYTRTIWNIKFGYNWMTSPLVSHTWNLMDFNMVNLYRFDPEFIESIRDLYIKSSFTDHLILAMNYSLVYNTQQLNTKRGYTYLRFNAESAGNLLNVLSSATNQVKVESPDTLGVGTNEYYRIFNTRYAQYIKTDLEFRYGYTIDKYNALVARTFLGVGLPYGNFDVLPFEKKYFTGGANGIRAWQVRSLGPGTYRAPSGAYPNQSSDIKLEANLEYRFRLISFIEGALFFDVGNIWAINDKDNREGAQFAFDTFYKQLAFGTGTGLRFDFSYFIFRLDLGMKLREPSDKFGDGWIPGSRRYTSDDFVLSFAIGYPF
jgi:outer membrane protein assembly factor BamA